MRRLSLAVAALVAVRVAAQPPPVPPVATADRPYPITLPAAFQLTGARSLDIALAAERTKVAVAQLERAEVLWLPTLVLGADYTRHDGRIQDIRGNVFPTSRSALFGGAGANLTFASTDAYFGPLAARQLVRAREADERAAANDTYLSVAEAYFNLQQARGDYAATVQLVRPAAEEALRRVEALAPALAPVLEINRAKVELSRRRQAVSAAEERWKLASADLGRVLRLDATARVEPAEPPEARVSLIDPTLPLDDLIVTALRSRPELQSRRALVDATLVQLKAEKLRPLLPSAVFRGNSTPSGSGLAGGVFGGGRNGYLGNFEARQDWDAQLVWEIQNLGFGNRARVRERRAEQQAALVDLFRVQDRVAAEVAQAHAQVVSATARVTEAEGAFKDAAALVGSSLEGAGQTRRVGEVLVLVVRPAEVVAAVQSLALASGDYYAATADGNRAQFRLYRALGHPGPAAVGN